MFSIDQLSLMKNESSFSCELTYYVMRIICNGRVKTCLHREIVWNKNGWKNRLKFAFLSSIFNLLLNLILNVNWRIKRKLSEKKIIFGTIAVKDFHLTWNSERDCTDALLSLERKVFNVKYMWWCGDFRTLTERWLLNSVSNWWSNEMISTFMIFLSN